VQGGGELSILISWWL